MAVQSRTQALAGHPQGRDLAAVGSGPCLGGAPEILMARQGPRSPEVSTALAPQCPLTAHTGVPFFGFKDPISLLEFPLKMQFWR